MKGLNCYASFLDEPGIEKILNPTPGKSSFLRPATLSPSQQGPFIQIAVAGLLVDLGLLFLQSMPAAVFFCLLHILHGGLRSSQLFSLRSVVLAARFKEIP